MESEVFFKFPSGSAAEDFAIGLVQKGYTFEETAMAPDPESTGVILGIRNLCKPGEMGCDDEEE